MDLTFFGAAGGVTGSAYRVRTSRATVLVDFGLFQGGQRVDRRNRVPAGLVPSRVDAVVLTHAHLDHSGRLPLLPSAGFTAPIWATPATQELTDLILRDSAHIQEADAEKENRARRRKGKQFVVPLYTAKDVAAVRRLYRNLPYQRPAEVAPGITVRFVDAGHILGSASVEMKVTEGNTERTIVFSGDVGPRGAPLLEDPSPFHRADVVVMESTYGDGDHEPLRTTLDAGRRLIREAVARRGRIIVPVFAVGRAQLVLYYVAAMFRGKEVKPFPVYLDSPMAIEATRIYALHPELFDAEARALRKSGELRPGAMRSLIPTPKTAQSQALNRAPGPCMILAGSGMCTGGRILHHLRHHLADPTTTVVFVGFQGEGSLGRMLVDGAAAVRIFGESIPVRASIRRLDGFSAHAGQTELIDWFRCLAPSRPRLFLTHGEDGPRKALGAKIEAQLGLKAAYPVLGETVPI